MSRAKRFWPGLFIASIGVRAAGFATQYGLANVAGPSADTPLFSGFNAAHYALDYPRRGFIKLCLALSILAGPIGTVHCFSLLRALVGSG